MTLGSPSVDEPTEQLPYRALYELTRTLATLDSADAVLGHVLESTASLLSAERVFLVKRDGHNLAFFARWGDPSVSRGTPMSRRIVAEAFERNEPLLVPDALADPTYSGRLSVRESKSRCVVAVRIPDRDLVLFADHREPGSLGAHETGVMAEVVLSAGRELARSADQLNLESDAVVTSLGLIAVDRATRAIVRDSQMIAQSDSPVLIEGPSGTGKELLARTIHALGDRSEGPLVVVNSASLTGELFESELFGHERGAFTDAKTTKRGLLEAADGGVLFLDEVGELPLELQAKLLRAIQFGEVRPVGANAPRLVDVRVVAATNRDLRSAVATGAFREDLYYRLAVLSLSVPPLAERPGDIVPLFNLFLERECLRLGQPAPKVEAELHDQLLGHDWPGNVRELENEVTRLLVMNPGLRRVEPSMFGFHVAKKPLESPLLDGERAVVERYLQRTGGNKTKAAELLGISREGLRKKMKRLGMD